VATLADLRRHWCWLWLNCRNPACGHCTPLALVPLMIRWSPDASTDRLRACALCTRCGARGANTTVPSWAGQDVGWAPFPEL
jgi:hypothetical protein